MRKNLLYYIVTFMFVFCVGVGSALAENTHAIDLEVDSNQFLQTQNINLTSSFTLEAIIRPESITQLGMIINSGDNSAQYWLMGLNKDGHIQMGYTNNNPSLTDTTTLSSGNSYYVAVVHDDTNDKDYIYINGSISSIATGKTGNPTAGGAYTRIGAHPHSANIYNIFDGTIDEVRIWDIARTSEEIASTYNQELSKDENGLIRYWKLNGDLTDISDNNDSLTNINNATFSTDVVTLVSASTETSSETEETANTEDTTISTCPCTSGYSALDSATGLGSTSNQDIKVGKDASGLITVCLFEAADRAFIKSYTVQGLSSIWEATYVSWRSGTKIVSILANNETEGTQREVVVDFTNDTTTEALYDL